MFETLGLDSWSVVIVLLSTLPIIYWYLTKNYNYWSKRGIDGPKPIPIFGNFLERVLNPMSTLDTAYRKKFGNIYGLFNGTDPVLQIAEPELIKEVLVKQFSSFINRRDLRTEHPIVNKGLFNVRAEEWKRLRTITSTTFTSGKIKGMYPIVRKCLQEYLDHLEVMADQKQVVDARRVHQNFTMDVISKCAFACDTNALNEPNSPFLQNLKKMFDMKPSLWIPSFVFPKSLNKLLNINTNFDQKANKWLIDWTRHILKRRRKGEKNNDFIQLLIDAKADDRTNDANDKIDAHHLNEGEDEILAEKRTLSLIIANKTLTDDEILAQAWVFLLGGFETTATTLGYLSYELALNPDCQEKLFNEVMTAIDSDREISYETLQKLPYLDACVSETLRLYPLAIRLEREVNSDFKLGDVSLFKGQLVEIPVYAIHHSEDYYKNADQFIPERFLAENRNQLVPYTYLPFGTGPRNCLGMRFALMEIKLGIAHIVMRLKFTRCAQTSVPLQFSPLTPMLATKHIYLGIEKR